MTASSGTDHLCGMSLAIDAVGGKWKLHLMWVLADGPVRFGEIRRKLDGVSEKVLSENLRQMEASGIVHREAASCTASSIRRFRRASSTP